MIVFQFYIVLGVGELIYYVISKTSKSDENIFTESKGYPRIFSLVGTIQSNKNTLSLRPFEWTSLDSDL